MSLGGHIQSSETQKARKMTKTFFISKKRRCERTLGKPRHRWKNNIRINFTELLCGYVKAIPLQAWTGPEDSTRLRLPDFKTIGIWW
jgi:hypothetical protein